MLQSKIKEGLNGRDGEGILSENSTLSADDSFHLQETNKWIIMIPITFGSEFLVGFSINQR